MTKLKKTSLWKNLNKNVNIIIDSYYGDYLLLLMIIDDYFIIIDNCSFIIDDYWLLLMIVIDYWLLLMIICYCNKENFSSIIYKVIRPVLNFLFFFYDKILQAPKSAISILAFFQGKILSTLNTLVFVQDKILYQI